MTDTILLRLIHLWAGSYRVAIGAGATQVGAWVGWRWYWSECSFFGPGSGTAVGGGVGTVLGAGAGAAAGSAMGREMVRIPPPPIITVRVPGIMFLK